MTRVGAQIHGPAGLRIRVVGSTGAHVDRTEIDLQPGQRHLLALLVAADEGGAGLDWLADEMWGEQLPTKWEASLRVAVSRLRKRLPAPVEVRNGRYQIRIDRAAVDAWHLVDLDRSSPIWDPAMEPYIEHTGIFPGVELSSALRQAAAAITAAQRSAIEKLSRAPIPVPAHLLLSLARHVEADPYDENLCYAVALIHARAGRLDEAAAMVERCMGLRTNTLGRSPSAQLSDLLNQVVGGRVTAWAPPAPGPERGPAREIRPPTPVALQRLRVSPFVGRRTELDELARVLEPEGPPVAVMRGGPACGKSSVLAELMHRAVEAGAYVARVAGTSGEPVALGPFSAALASFRTTLISGDHLQMDASVRRGLLSVQLLDALDTEAMGRPIVLVVDDAHWLDSMSCELVDFLAHSAGEGALSLVIAARATENPGPWAELSVRLDRLPFVANLRLEPLAEAEMAELVADRRPDAPLAARAQLTRWLHEASGGLPGVAAAMLDAGIDEQPGDHLPVNDVFDRRLDPLDAEARDVGLAAAVLGARFHLSDLAALLGRSEESLEPVLAALAQRDLINETGVLGHFEFSHQLVVDAFLRCSVSTRRARLHLEASRLVTSVHELARHRVAAGPLVDQGEARATVVASARQHLGDGAFWESVGAFRLAITVGAQELDTATMVDYATALSLAGRRSPGATMRERAFEQAESDQRWDLAHDAAISGLPAAEIEDGERDRLRQLLAVPSHLLDRGRQLSQALNIARQAAMLGQSDVADEWADRASGLAANDDERAEAALGRRFVDTIIAAPAERQERMATALAGLTLAEPARCRMLQFTAIDCFERGQLPDARRALDRFEALAQLTSDTQRQWHALLFRSMLAETDGDWETADGLAADGRRLGRRSGIAQADIVWLAQTYFRLRLMDQLAILADAVNDIPAIDGQSMLFASARATVFDAAERTSEAAEETGRIVRAALERPSAAGLGCLALLAPLVGRYGTPSLREGARAALTPFIGSALVLGAGLGNLGPVHHLVAALDRPTGPARERALQKSIRQADQFGMRSWSVRYRVDLACLTGAQEPLDQARALAENTSLTKLVELAGGR